MTAEQSKALATLDISRARRAEAEMAQSVTLVTGASGFLGKAVTKQLAENSVCTVGLDPRPSPTTHVVDALSDRQKLKMLLTAEKITHIIHAGGVSGPMVLADDPAEVIAINVLGSLNLLYAALESGVRTFVYCSSAAALGNFYEDEPVDDQYPLRPNNTYSASKAAMEMVLQGLWTKIPLDLCSLRFTVIYGPGRETTFTLEEIVRAALAGETARIQPMTDWPYVYIDDAGAQSSRPASQTAGSTSAISLRIRKKSPPTTSPRRRLQQASQCAWRSMPANQRPRGVHSISSLLRAISGFARKSVIARGSAA